MAVRFPEAVMGYSMKFPVGSRENYKYDGDTFVMQLAESAKYVFDISPTAYATNGPKGVSIANPISHVVLRRGETATIDFNPSAVAIAGPGGIAIAESELDVLEYIPKI